LLGRTGPHRSWVALPFADLVGNRGREVIVVGRAVEPHTTPKAPEDRQWDWHGTAEKDKADEIIERGGWEAFRDAHAWYDPGEDAEHDPPLERQAYKFPHHEVVDGRIRVVWHGVRSAMQILAGARGGAGLPDADRKHVYRHLAAHYEEFEKEPPGFEEIES
jgi:hypothetical protein